MKKFFAVMLACVLSVFTLASCGSTAPKVQKAFEKAGYTVVSKDITDENSVLKGLYFCRKGVTFTVFFELGTTDDLEQAIVELKDNEDCKNLITLFGSDAKAVAKKLKDEGLVNGNCILLALDLDSRNIFKNA